MAVQKIEPYKHYFYVFNEQIKNLPENQDDRLEHVKEIIKEAINNFRSIEESDVLLDENSDGSHLPIWYNVLNSFKKNILS